MKFKFLLLATMPIAIYAQDDVVATKSEVLPNTFSSGSSKIEEFKSSSKRFNDWAISAGVGTAFIMHGDLTSFYRKVNECGCSETVVNWGWNSYISLDKQISHTFGLSLQFQMGETQQQGKMLGKMGDLAGIATANTKFRQLSLLGDLNLSNLIRRVDNLSEFRWALHAYAGMGLQGYDTKLNDIDPFRGTPRTIELEQNNNFSSFFYQGGLGLKYKISRRVDIEARSMYVITGDDEFDGGGMNKEYYKDAGDAYNRIDNSRSDNVWTFNIGATVKFGKHISHLTWHDPLQEIYSKAYALEKMPTAPVICEKGDNDNDGVCDDWDRQLDTPAGARVDGAGVALDMDLDGVIDLYDKCVTVPGTVENNGCPVEKTITKPKVIQVKTK